MLSIIVLIVVAVGFAWNLGVHYTGAVMGMPYAAYFTGRDRNPPG